jgi:hypothetical protein
LFIQPTQHNPKVHVFFFGIHLGSMTYILNQAWAKRLYFVSFEETKLQAFLLYHSRLYKHHTTQASLFEKTKHQKYGLFIQATIVQPQKQVWIAKGNHLKTPLDTLPGIPEENPPKPERPYP